MSEIASKANAGTSSSLAQPFVKNSGDTTHEMLFAALFGGVVAAENNSDPMAEGIAPVDADTESSVNPERDLNILAAMQAMAEMISGRRGTGIKDELSAEPDKAITDDNLIVEDDDIVDTNPMVIGPMPLQQQLATPLPAAETSAVTAQMAFEDDAVMPHQRNDWVKPIPQRTTSHSTGLQLQMAALPSSSLPQTMKPAAKSLSDADSIDEIPTIESNIEAGQLRSDGRPDKRSVVRTTPYQNNINQVSLTNSKSTNGFDQALINIDGDMQFDIADDFRRIASVQAERTAGGISGQPVSGESLSANAVRQMQLGGMAVGTQMSQQNNAQYGGQTGGQSGGLISASVGMTNGSMMDILDMAQDNWTEMLLQRVERGLAGGKDKIDFHLNPRNLGRMRISLLVQNERTNVHIQTETSAAAHLLNDAEARLAQMMDASGLKFGNLTSQYNQNFGGNFAGQNSEHGRENASAHATASDTSDGKDETDAESSVEKTENLINMQA